MFDYRVCAGFSLEFSFVFTNAFRQCCNCLVYLAVHLNIHRAILHSLTVSFLSWRSPVYFCVQSGPVLRIVGSVHVVVGHPEHGSSKDFAPRQFVEHRCCFRQRMHLEIRWRYLKQVIWIMRRHVLLNYRRLEFLLATLSGIYIYMCHQLLCGCEK